MRLSKKLSSFIIIGLMTISSSGCVKADAIGQNMEKNEYADTALIQSDIETPDTSTVIVHSDDLKSAEDVVSTYNVTESEAISDYQAITFSSDIDALQAKDALINAGIDAVYDSSFEIQDNDETVENGVTNADTEQEQTETSAEIPDEDVNPDTSEDSESDVALSEEQSSNQSADAQEDSTIEPASTDGHVKVAVIDTGVSGIDCQKINLTDSSDEDINGHGTKVAQTIINNSNGNADILSIKAMGDDGKGSMVTVAKAIQAAQENGADIINLSISAYDDGSMTALKQIITEAINAGIKVVSAAGNYNSSAMVYVPSDITNVISVGSVDESGNKTLQSNYGATYYEVADSTSIASAILVGKLAAGNDLSQEWTNDTITFDKNAINPSPFSEGETTSSYNEETGMHSVEHKIYINVSRDMYQHAYDIGAKYWIFSEKDISNSLSRYADTSYDKTYGNNFWFYGTEDLYKADLKQATEDNAEYTANKIDENALSTQTLYGTASGYMQAGIDYTGKGGSSAYMSVTRRISSGHTMARYWVWYANQGGSEHYGGGTGTYENASGDKCLGEWTDTGKYGVISISGQVKAVVGGTGWNGTTLFHSTSSTSYNTGNTQAASGLLNVNLIGPDGGEKLDGSIGTFSYTYSNWGETGKLNVADCCEGKDTGTYYRIGQLKLKNGIIATEAYVTDNTGTYGVNVWGDGFVRQVYGTTTVTIKTRYANVTVYPNGGTWSDSRGSTVKTCTSPEGTVSIQNPTRIGYTFAGWTLSGGGSISGTTYKYGTSDGALTANWNQLPIPFVNYDTNGGSKSTEIVNPNGYTIIDDGVYNIQSKLGAQRYIHVDSASTEKGSTIVIWEGAGWGALQTCWQFERVGNTPYYYIINRNNGLALNIPGDSNITASSTGTEMWTQINGTNEANSDFLWYLKDAGNGYVWICNKKTNRILDIYNATDANGTKVIIYDNNGGDGQKWKLNALRVHTNAYGQRPLYSGANVLVNSVTPVKKGYVFSGWNTSRNGGGTMYHASDEITYTGSDITLYAQWTPLYENSTLDKLMNNTYYNELAGDMQGKIQSTTIAQGIYDFNQSSGVTFSYTEGFSTSQAMKANKTQDQSSISRKVFAPGFAEIRDYLGDNWKAQNLNKLFYGTTSATTGSAWIRDTRYYYYAKGMAIDGDTGGVHSHDESSSLQSRPTYKVALSTKK